MFCVLLYVFFSLFFFISVSYTNTSFPRILYTILSLFPSCAIYLVHPAVGRAEMGGYRYHAPRQQYSSRDIAANLEIKTRKVGQNAPSEIKQRDLKQELDDREQAHENKKILEKQRKGLLPMESSIPDPNIKMARIDWQQFSDDDDSGEDEDDSDEDSDDSGDEEAELMRELERIKQEREEERKRKEQEESEAQDKVVQAAMPQFPSASSTTFGVKRRWDDDVVFKNQTRDVAPVKKRFINDTIRSDFHKRFLKRYIQ